jgi:hypothetical protein
MHHLAISGDEGIDNFSSRTPPPIRNVEIIASESSAHRHRHIAPLERRADAARACKVVKKRQKTRQKREGKKTALETLKRGTRTSPEYVTPVHPTAVIANRK